MNTDTLPTPVAETDPDRAEARLQIARARVMAERAGSNRELIPDNPDSAGVYYHRGYLVGLVGTLADTIARLLDSPPDAQPDLWTRCDVALPAFLAETVGTWMRQESAEVLARNSSGEVDVARWTQWSADEDGEQQPGAWYQRGRDSYDLDDVIEWREIPR